MVDYDAYHQGGRLWVSLQGGNFPQCSAVRWGVAGRIDWAWILTIPNSAFIAAIAWWLGQYLF